MLRTLEFDQLERYAAQFNHYEQIVPWLITIGAIPNDVERVKPSQVKLELDSASIPAGYLASVAYEWDEWGPSSPVDFVEALRAELKNSSQRDAISRTLLALGRSMESWT